MSKPSLFIGSSTEGLDFARAVRSSLSDVAETTLWNDGVFSLGRTFIESLISAVARFDFAALILTPDDQMIVRNDETLGPRDNIIFELGLFMGRLGRERTFIVRPASGRLKIPSDLAGISVAAFDWPRSDGNHRAALGPASDLMREVIRDLGFAPAKTDAHLRALQREQEQQQVQVNQQQELVEQQQRMIDELVRYAMSASIFRHLCGIALLKEYKYSHDEGNRREFYFLRDAGYIKPRSDGFIEFHEGLNGKNIAEIAEATPIGKLCVKLRQSEIPPQMLGDLNNLRVKPNEL
jgi:Predicted nucleotide-binding protein containing TIR-like domain